MKQGTPREENLIDAVAGRLAHDPDLDIDHYASEVAKIFDPATRIGG